MPSVKTILTKISKRREVTRNRKFLEAFLEEVKKATWRQGRFVIPGFVIFTVKKAKARSIANPQTGAMMQLLAQKAVKARVSKWWRTKG